MIFYPLWETAKRNELILIEGGFCHWHLRKDGYIVMYEIISIRPGAGSEMLEVLKAKSAHSIYAKCPIDLEANKWYEKKGFELEEIQTTRTGKELKCWRLTLEQPKIMGLSLDDLQIGGIENE